jgi:hypothetical protein
MLALPVWIFQPMLTPTALTLDLLEEDNALELHLPMPLPDLELLLEHLPPLEERVELQAWLLPLS